MVEQRGPRITRRHAGPSFGADEGLDPAQSPIKAGLRLAQGRCLDHRCEAVLGISGGCHSRVDWRAETYPSFSTRECREANLI
jgi:hypothetical protein